MVDADRVNAPAFEPHRWIRGGHLQTLISFAHRSTRALQTTSITVDVSDGDQIVLHRDDPDQNGGGSSGVRGNVLLIHGLTGCHAAPYMLRHVDDLLGRGYRTYRMDMRGFGASRPLVRNISHAGRSDDVLAALDHIANTTSQTEPILAMGISLGGAQLLRLAGRIDSAMQTRPNWWSRIENLMAVCPPIDLIACSRNMQRRRLRLYNRYFIRSLLERVPPMVAQREDYRKMVAGRRPRTLWEFDDRITAPLSGFADATQYYRDSSAASLLPSLRTPTTIVATRDDPIIPFGMFDGLRSTTPKSICLVTPDHGGHNGFHSADRKNWLVTVLLSIT